MSELHELVVNKFAIEVLSSFSNINTASVFNPIDYSVRDIDRTRFGVYTGLKAPFSFGVSPTKKIAQSLDALGTDKVYLSEKNDHILIKSEEDEKEIRIKFTEPKHIDPPPPGSYTPEAFQKMAVLDFVLTGSEIKEINKINKLLENTEIEFKVSPGELVIKTYEDQIEMASDTFQIKKEIDYQGKGFKLVFDSSYFSYPINGDYRVYLSEQIMIFQYIGDIDGYLMYGFGKKTVRR